jgi:hypothetical protein
MTRQASTTAQPCNDCRVDTSLATGNGHYYAVREDVWRRAVPTPGEASGVSAPQKPSPSLPASLGPKNPSDQIAQRVDRRIPGRSLARRSAFSAGLAVDCDRPPPNAGVVAEGAAERVRHAIDAAPSKADRAGPPPPAHQRGDERPRPQPTLLRFASHPAATRIIGLDDVAHRLMVALDEHAHHLALGRR